MSNTEKLAAAFEKGLKLPEGVFDEQLEYETIQEWDWH